MRFYLALVALLCSTGSIEWGLAFRCRSIRPSAHDAKRSDYTLLFEAGAPPQNAAAAVSVFQTFTQWIIDAPDTFWSQVLERADVMQGKSKHIWGPD
jgi:hypothetical protein